MASIAFAFPCLPLRTAHRLQSPRRLRSPPRHYTLPSACQRADRETDARGFVLPQAGDVVLYQGKWPGEDEAGLVESIRFIDSRSVHVVDVAPLRRVTDDLFAVPRARRNPARWFDVGEVRVVPDAAYVPRQDAYRVAGTRDGYAPVPAPSPEQRARADEEYRVLQESMRRTTLISVAIGAALPLLAARPDLSASFAAGGAASFAYLVLLQKAVDTVATEAPLPLRLLPALRFVVPAIPFLLFGLPRLPSAPVPADLLGSVSREEALAIVAGLLMYKVPLLRQTGGEFVDGLADIEMGKTGMLGTAASLVAREVRKRRDAGKGDEMADSPRAKQRVLVFAGPSGVGKSTLISRLREELPGQFAYSVSHTTRAPRDGEEDGREYNFVTMEEFERMLGSGEFLEHARVHKECYGTSVSAVEKVAADGRVCLLDLDVQGVQTLRKKTDLEWDPRYVWVASPSVEVLADRLRGRGTETEESLKVRLETATREISFAATNNVFDIIVINDKMDEAFDELRGFVERTQLEWGS